MTMAWGTIAALLRMLTIIYLIVSVFQTISKRKITQRRRYHVILVLYVVVIVGGIISFFL
jgi:hypothetical protein